MTALLVIATVVEIALVVAVLAIYLGVVNSHLQVISGLLGKVAFGVRAVETQTGAIGPGVAQVNRTLGDIDSALGPLTEKAHRASSTLR